MFAETNGETRFRWPADYYSAPAGKGFVPRWLVFGCGGASVLVLALLFAGGAFLSGSGFTDFMDMVLGMSIAEMKGMYAEAIPADGKKSLESEIEAMRENLRDGKISVADLQPFLQKLRGVMSDNTVTAEEAHELERTARTINTRRPPPR